MMIFYQSKIFVTVLDTHVSYLYQWFKYGNEAKKKYTYNKILVWHAIFWGYRVKIHLKNKIDFLNRYYMTLSVFLFLN